MRWKNGNAYKILVGKHKGRHHLVDIGVSVRIILTQEILGRTNRLLFLIRHGLNRK
jgi:hypothetical protein